MTAQPTGPAVVIPIHGSAHLAARAIESVTATVPAWTRIILVDDASFDAEVDSLLAPESLSRFGPERIEVIRNERNLGFPGTVNVALQSAVDADVVVVNSDVVVPIGWYQVLADAASTLPRAATLSVLANNGTMLSVPYRNQPAPDFPILEHVGALAAGRAQLRPIEVSNAVGHVLYLTRAALRAVGELDEHYAPGYGEEVDFSLRAAEAGFVNYVVPGIAVHHEGSGSFGSEREALIRRNARLVQERYPYVWGRAGEDETGTAHALAGLLATTASSIRPVVAHLLGGKESRPESLPIAGSDLVHWTDQPEEADVILVNVTSDLPDSLGIDREQRIVVLFERTELVTRQWYHLDVTSWKRWLERVRTLCLSADAVLAREPEVVVDRGLALKERVHRLRPAPTPGRVLPEAPGQAALLLGPIDSVEFLRSAASEVTRLNQPCIVGQPVPHTWCRAHLEMGQRDGLGMSTIPGYRGRRPFDELRSEAGWPRRALVWAPILDEVIWAVGGQAETGTPTDSPWRELWFTDGSAEVPSDLLEVVRATMRDSVNPVRCPVATSPSGDVLFLDPPPPILAVAESGTVRRGIRARSVLDSLRYEGISGSVRKARRRMRGSRAPGQ